MSKIIISMFAESFGKFKKMSAKLSLPLTAWYVVVDKILRFITV